MIAPRRATLLLLIIALPAVALAAPGDGGAGGQRQPDSDDYPCNTFGLAHAYHLRERLTGEAALGSFARPVGKSPLEQLRVSSAISSEVMVVDNRMLWSLSPKHPMGPLKLVVVDEADGRLVVLDARAHKKFNLPLHRLPDLLEGSAKSVRTHHTLDIRPGGNAAPPGSGTVALETWNARVGLRHSAAPGGRRISDLRMDVRLQVAVGPRRLPHRDPLLALALPALLDADGLKLLETLSFTVGRPLNGWSVAVQNTRGEARGEAPTVTTELMKHGWVRIPLCRLSTVRPAYTDASGEPVMEAAGKQLVKPAELAGLRGQAPAGPLTVENRGPAAAMIYLDGVLLGWVAPYKQHSFRGVPAGFYRVYARTPLGSNAWGPYDMYIPGPVVLR